MFMKTSTVRRKNMESLNILRTKTVRKISFIFTALVVFLTTQPSCAQTTSKGLEILIGMQYGLGIIIPIFAAIILFFLLLIYMCRIISRITFARWAFSVIIAGAAFYISSILFYIN
uniref:TrwM-like protein n=2 Tax=Bartonella henselae (strain ATCC 49882 / DSM 28221 / CCUG 30454 / Houston 1) TaxID=283166 RepID=Q4L2T4_BARHE|nr:TrwM-like protein [Bartonella henselae str. Houston-1]